MVSFPAVWLQSCACCCYVGLTLSAGAPYPMTPTLHTCPTSEDPFTFTWNSWNLIQCVWNSSQPNLWSECILGTNPSRCLVVNPDVYIQCIKGNIFIANVKSNVARFIFIISNPHPRYYAFKQFGKARWCHGFGSFWFVCYVCNKIGANCEIRTLLQ